MNFFSGFGKGDISELLKDAQIVQKLVDFYRLHPGGPLPLANRITQQFCQFRDSNGRLDQLAEQLQEEILEKKESLKRSPVRQLLNW